MIVDYVFDLFTSKHVWSLSVVDEPHMHAVFKEQS